MYEKYNIAWRRREIIHTPNQKIYTKMLMVNNFECDIMSDLYFILCAFKYILKFLQWLMLLLLLGKLNTN